VWIRLESTELRAAVGASNVDWEFAPGVSAYGSTNAICGGRWHRVALSFDGSTARLYWDGVERASAAASSGADGTDVCVGARDATLTDPADRTWIKNLRVWPLAQPTSAGAFPYAAAESAFVSEGSADTAAAVTDAHPVLTDGGGTTYSCALPRAEPAPNV
jgi:hypothetical protein